MGGRGSQSGLSFSIPPEQKNYSQNALIDQLPKTVQEALGDKGKERSISEAIQTVNPFHSYDYSEYSENCQRCVVAYEMQRRGYDVEAQPTYAGDKWPMVVPVNGQRLGRWRGAFRHAVTDRVGAAGNNSSAEKKVLENIKTKMREYGSGARAVVNIQYRGRGSGHVFNVENQKGHITFVDAQTGERYNTASMHNLLAIVETQSVGLTRTDNLRISGRITNFVWQNHQKRRK
jgi:hypothetical protein